MHSLAPVALGVLAVGVLLAVSRVGPVAGVLVSFRLPLAIIALLATAAAVAFNSGSGGSGSLRNWAVVVLWAVALAGVGLVVAHGLDLEPGSFNSAKILTLALGMVGLLVLGAPGLVAAIYLGAILSAQGTQVLLYALPSYLWPYAAYAVVLGLAAVALSRRPRETWGAVGEAWGLKYVLLYAGLGIVWTPFYAKPVDHSWYVFLPVFFFAVLATEPKDRIFALAKTLLVAAFLYQVGVVLYKAVNLETLQGVTFASRWEGGPGRIGGFNVGAVLWIQTFCIIAPIALTAMRERKVPIPLQAVVWACGLYAFWRGDVRTGLVAVPLQLTTYLWAVGKKTRALVVALALSVGILALPVLLRPFADVISTGGIAGGELNNLGLRFLLWEQAFQQLSAQPIGWLTGLGAGGRQYTAGLFSSYSPHSSWVFFVSSVGIPGAVLMALFFFDVARKEWHKIRTSDGWSREWLAAGLASLVGALVFSLTGAIEEEMTMLSIVLVVLCVWARATRDDDAESAPIRPAGGPSTLNASRPESERR